jgi:hypothetical protein
MLYVCFCKCFWPVAVVILQVAGSRVTGPAGPVGQFRAELCLFQQFKFFKVSLGEYYSLNLLQNCLISVLKIGEKVYAKWLLYPNKNYSYSSCNPFIDNAPYWRE